MPSFVSFRTHAGYFLFSWYYESLHQSIEISGTAQVTIYHIKLVVDNNQITEDEIQQ